MSADNKSRPTREECEAVTREEAELQLKVAANHSPSTPISLHRFKVLAQSYIALLDSHDEALRTIEVLSNNDILEGIAEGVADMQAGRTVALSCVQGGCERDALLKRLDSHEQTIQQLQADKERLHKDLWLVLDSFAAHCEMTTDLDADDGALMAQIRADHPRDTARGVQLAKEGTDASN